MIPRNAEDFVAPVAQARQELARFLELLGAGTLREVAANDDQIGFRLVDAFLHSFN